MKLTKRHEMTPKKTPKESRNANTWPKTKLDKDCKTKLASTTNTARDQKEDRESQEYTRPGKSNSDARAKAISTVL